MYKQDLVLNKAQWLICQRTLRNQTIPLFIGESLWVYI